MKPYISRLCQGFSFRVLLFVLHIFVSSFIRKRSVSQIFLGAVAAVTFFVSGCATTDSMLPTIPGDMKAEVMDLLPPRDSRNAVDRQIQYGIDSLLNNQYKKASQDFGGALRLDPQNSYVQFLNGLTYHLMAETGDSTQYEFAKTGYQLALKFNNNNWLAAKQLARLYLKTKKYPLSQEHFAYGLLYQPDNVQMLYGLAQASYYSHDLETALGAINRARELSPNDQDILAASSLISAAAGQTASASAQLELYKNQEQNKLRIQRIADRVNDWLKLHRDLPSDAAPDNLSASTEKTPALDSTATSDLKKEEVLADKQVPRMVIVDVVLIRTEEAETTSKGVNLLEGLTLQFSDSYISWKGGDTKEKITSSQLSLLDVKYNMNIFNIGEDKTEVLARPTLVAIEGQKSTFFSGSQLAVSVSGVDTASLEKIDVGVRLEITPTFITDDTVVINATVGRSFIEPGVVGSFHESVRTSKNELSANVALKIGQTLILGGLREKQTSEIKSGVPILRDIPLLQYFFSHESTVDYHKSIITIITPRRVLPGVYVSSESIESGEPAEEANKHPYLDELRKSTSSLFTVDNNIRHIMRHINKHKSIREFRESDLFDTTWYGSTGDLTSILKNTITFLYY